jgi:hypothetical protein
MNKQFYNFFMGVGISTFYIGTVALFCKSSDYFKKLNIQRFK